MEDKLSSYKELEHHLERMNDKSKIYMQYRASKNPNSFREKYRTEIMLYEASVQYVKLYRKNNPIPSIPSLRRMISESEESKRELHARLNQKKETLKELEVVKKNIQSIYPKKQTQEKDLGVHR